MPSNRVTVAVMAGRTLSSSSPCRTARETNSGNSTAESEVWKNFSTMSLPAPLTWMSNRFSCRWKASSPSRAVPRYPSLGSSSSSVWAKVRPPRPYISFSSLTFSK